MIVLVPPILACPCRLGRARLQSYPQDFPHETQSPGLSRLRAENALGRDDTGLRNAVFWPFVDETHQGQPDETPKGNRRHAPTMIVDIRLAATAQFYQTPLGHVAHALRDAHMCGISSYAAHSCPHIASGWANAAPFFLRPAIGALPKRVNLFMPRAPGPYRTGAGREIAALSRQSRLVLPAVDGALTRALVAHLLRECPAILTSLPATKSWRFLARRTCADHHVPQRRELGRSCRRHPLPG